MQSICYDTAFNKPGKNMLVCAPTGAGKTNVAMLAALGHFRNKGVVCDERPGVRVSVGKKAGGGGGGGGKEFEGGMKVIYIAPMKALAQEVVEKFGARLKVRGVKIEDERRGEKRLLTNNYSLNSRAASQARRQGAHGRHAAIPGGGRQGGRHRHHPGEVGCRYEEGGGRELGTVGGVSYYR